MDNGKDGKNSSFEVNPNGRNLKRLLKSFYLIYLHEEYFMSSVDIMSLYKKFGNLFKINVKSLGKIYELGTEIDDSLDKKATIYYDGKYYSFKAYKGSNQSDLTQEILTRFLRKNFYLALRNKGYRFPKKYRTYRGEEDKVTQPHPDIFRIFKGFRYSIIDLENDVFLCIDPCVILESVSSVADLIHRGIPPSSLNDFSVRCIGDEGFRIDGYLTETATGKALAQESNSDYFCRINRYRKEKGEPEEEIVPAKNVFSESRPELIQTFLGRLGIDFDIIRLIRSLSFLDSPTPSLDRFVQTMNRVDELNSSGIFPLKFGKFSFELNKQPIVLKL